MRSWDTTPKSGECCVSGHRHPSLLVPVESRRVQVLNIVRTEGSFMRFWLLPRILGITLVIIILLVLVTLSLAGIESLLQSLTELLFLILGGLGALALELLFWPERFMKSTEAMQPMSKAQEPTIKQATSLELQVLTRAEIEREFPFDRFVSQVKHGGELVIMARAFSSVRPKLDVIKRLITEENITVTILLLAPTATKRREAVLPTTMKTVDVLTDFSGEVERDFKWQGLSADIEGTRNLLCGLRKGLKGLRDHLVIRTYDRIPILSMIVIDPSTEDAIMQVGTYLSGMNASAQLQIIIHKKIQKDVFEKYWDEYKLIRDKHSHTVDYGQIESEFPSP